SPYSGCSCGPLRRDDVERVGAEAAPAGGARGGVDEDAGAGRQARQDEALHGRDVDDRRGGVAPRGEELARERVGRDVDDVEGGAAAGEEPLRRGAWLTVRERVNGDLHEVLQRRGRPPAPGAMPRRGAEGT